MHPSPQPIPRQAPAIHHPSRPKPQWQRLSSHVTLVPASQPLPPVPRKHTLAKKKPRKLDLLLTLYPRIMSPPRLTKRKNKVCPHTQPYTT
ncbi:hypothetical protein T440DRAFT_246334 [Plenodomus tracheiphilus IPT5]|uniref:Uncharacterized protein n=1 Tax=Plenodomus tracheiphilus IPT5 TaxID=1408161 RepID=A0A6A7ASE6_9PLEO|nr:hypothetical protein T440DRAFT_246334 [Plenodomus tracheiphilus IPT5]